MAKKKEFPEYVDRVVFDESDAPPTTNSYDLARTEARAAAWASVAKWITAGSTLVFTHRAVFNFLAWLLR